MLLFIWHSIKREVRQQYIDDKIYETNIFVHYFSCYFRCNELKFEKKILRETREKHPFTQKNSLQLIIYKPNFRS